MKSPSALNSGIAAVLLSGLLMAGCGQPGPLYMPKPPAKPAAKPAAPLTPPPSSTVSQ